MAQDLRKIFNEEREKRYTMKAGHEKRFEKRLNNTLRASPKNHYTWLWIAASVLILVGVGIYGYLAAGTSPEAGGNTLVTTDQDNAGNERISLGDLSPDLRKVEDYYVVNINMALSELVISGENKGLVDDYMKRLGELNREYMKLNTELNEIGPNDQTINALIKNLQLRLQLLQKLKVKLNEFKSSENEQVTSVSM